VDIDDDQHVIGQRIVGDLPTRSSQTRSITLPSPDTWSSQLTGRRKLLKPAFFTASMLALVVTGLPQKVSSASGLEVLPVASSVFPKIPSRAHLGNDIETAALLARLAVLGAHAIAARSGGQAGAERQAGPGLDTAAP
jgi:hypothetical protein